MPTLLQTYWILRGMITNKMFDKVEEMLRNYAYLIEKYNFIPYTNRVYALDRAQYPLFALMVEDYKERVENPKFLQEILPVSHSYVTYFFKTALFVGIRVFLTWICRMAGGYPVT